MSSQAHSQDGDARTGSAYGAEPVDGKAAPSAARPDVAAGAGPMQARYAISVVAGLVGTGQQNIRLYETRGLLTPHRTPGGTRQYSDRDVAVLLRIAELLEEGLNLAGVAKVLELEAINAKLRSDLKRARSQRRKHADGQA